MSLFTKLRLLLVTEVLLLVIVALLTFYTDQYLPKELRNYNDSLYQELNTKDFIAFALVILIIIANISSLILLFLKKYLGKIIYISISIFAHSIYFVVGPDVSHQYLSLFSSLLTCLNGIIIGLLIFTPVISKPNINVEQQN